jgi:dihydrolipoamide dehydrogenase
MGDGPLGGRGVQGVNMQYDLIILGGGPAGYIAAQRAGNAGKTVLVVEQRHPGGVCLNAGCIPTKTLLYSAKNYRSITQGHVHGIAACDPKFSMQEAARWKGTVIETYRKGILALFAQAGVTHVTGAGRLIDRSTVEVGSERYSASMILIATGSRPALPPIPGLAESPAVVTSTGLLERTTLCDHLCIIGAGVIGLEFAALYSMLGVKVTVIEMLDHIAPIVEPEIRKILKRTFSGVDFELGSRVTGIDGNQVSYTRKGKDRVLTADTILIAAGRIPNSDQIGLDAAGVKTSGGHIIVNSRMETSAPRVYAAGDVVGTSLFAHSASRMAEVAVDVMLGDRNTEMAYHAIPWAIYTWPEVAGCGYTEAQAAAEGIEVITSSVPMRLSARYVAEHGSAPSLVKMVVKKQDRKLIGLQMIGSTASEMLWGATMAINLGLTIEEIADTIFAHPTISEVIGDALRSLL